MYTQQSTQLYDTYDTPYSVHYSTHSTLYALHSRPSTPGCKVLLHCPLYCSAHCIIYTVLCIQWTYYIVRCTLYPPRHHLLSVHCTLHIILAKLFILHATLSTQEARYAGGWPNMTSAWASWRGFDIPVDTYGGVHSLLRWPSRTMGSPTYH
jgi:hypothetical protein